MNELHLRFRYAIRRNCGKDWQVKRRVIDYYNLVFILDGEAAYRVNDQQLTVRKNQVLMIPSGSLREAHRQSGCSLILQSFDFFCTPSLPPFPEPLLTLDSLSRWMPLLDEFHHHWLQEDALSMLRCHALFLQILDALYRVACTKQKNIHVRQMKQFIESHLKQTITMPELARHCGLNAVYCGALFKKETGMSVSQYRRQLQIRLACQLLREPDITISETAWQAGFNDLYSFSRCFKQKMGVSPRQYRQQQGTAERF